VTLPAPLDPAILQTLKDAGYVAVPRKRIVQLNQHSYISGLMLRARDREEMFEHMRRSIIYSMGKHLFKQGGVGFRMDPVHVTDQDGVALVGTLTIIWPEGQELPKDLE
jgi:hypothetical protein